jgi:hypothetical protein
MKITRKQFFLKAAMVVAVADFDADKLHAEEEKRAPRRNRVTIGQGLFDAVKGVRLAVCDTKGRPLDDVLIEANAVPQFLKATKESLLRKLAFSESEANSDILLYQHIVVLLYSSGTHNIDSLIIRIVIDSSDDKLMNSLIDTWIPRGVKTKVGIEPKKE